MRAAPGRAYIVTGMQEDTKYELRVASLTSAGVGDYSPARLEKTKKSVATAAPSVIHTSGAAVVAVPDCLYRHWMLTFFIAALVSANLCM